MTAMSLLIDLAGILIVYSVYAVNTVLIYGLDRFTGDELARLPLEMLCISLGCTLLWYALGEWVIRPTAPSGTWYAVWFLLLAIIVGAAAYITFAEGREALVHSDAEAHPWLHFVGGVGYYYVASVLFSPTFAKFRIWPARHVRKW